MNASKKSKKPTARDMVKVRKEALKLTTKLQITLKGNHAIVLERAIDEVIKDKGWGDDRIAFRQFVLKWAIEAVALAILRQREFPTCLSVDLREETEAESAARLGRHFFRYKPDPETNDGDDDEVAA